MKTIPLLLMLILTLIACDQRKETMKTNDSKTTLTPLQYNVVKENGTEPPFRNEFWDNKREGIYVDIQSGEALFSSTDKFDSGTGWPSFTRPIAKKNVKEKTDRSHGMTRVEVRSLLGDSHLGHLFDDGPAPTGQRYCINSASLRFVPKEMMQKEGYGEYLYLFDKKNGAAAQTERAIFAAGCFWGVEHILGKIDGVISTRSGYIGGATANPGYYDVSRGNTGHAEAVEVVYDPKKVTYNELLSWFWRLHDPTQLNRQGPDTGTQYRSAIFYTTEKQRAEAEKSRDAFDRSGVFPKKAVTTLEKAETFYPAEEYHQKYYEKNGGRVCHVLREK